MEKVRLGDVCTINGGYAFKSDKFSTEGVPVIRIGNITKVGLIIDEDVCYDENFWNENDSYRIAKNDILIAMSGATVGKSCINNTERKLLLNQRVAAINCDNNINLKYIFYSIDSEKFSKYIMTNSIGCAQPNISLKQIANFEIPAVCVEEQNRIAGELDKVADVINKRKQQLKKLDELVKARFVELFGGLERSTTIARYISELRGGKSLAGTEPCKNKVLKTGAATFGWFDPEQYKYLPTDYEPLPEHKVETGDVIISRMNTPELVGACSYVFDAPEDMYYPDRLWKAVLKENTNPIFLWQLLWDRDIRKAIKESSGGTSGTMHNISKANLLAIKCMDAPIELQNAYAEFVKQTDKSKLEVQKSLEKLEVLKKALMQKYFG
jgi:type I restriction enzyme S subunit